MFDVMEGDSKPSGGSEASGLTAWLCMIIKLVASYV